MAHKHHRSPLFEIARLLVRFDHVARFVVNANHGVPIRLAKLARFLQNSAHMKTTTLPLRSLMNRSPLRAFLLIPFVLACFALSPQARAVCQEGCLTSFNTVLGEDALFSLTTGEENTATGYQALYFNTTGNFNTAIGAFALQSNTTGFGNTATGSAALLNSSTGFENTAIGGAALLNSSTGFSNTATGSAALASNTTGNENTATGFHALLNNKTGNKNIALGFRAGSDLTTGDKNIDIDNAGLAGESSTIRIGRIQDQTATFIAGISGGTVPTGVAVIVDANGHLGTTTSSARLKEAIHPMDKASEAILALKPVTFRYKQEIDPEGIPQFGLVAEEVEKVNPDLVARDDEGKVYTVRYEAVNAMLLNEFLKEHKKVQELEATVVKLQSTIEKVSARLEARDSKGRLVDNR